MYSSSLGCGFDDAVLTPLSVVAFFNSRPYPLCRWRSQIKVSAWSRPILQVLSCLSHKRKGRDDLCVGDSPWLAFSPIFRHCNSVKEPCFEREWRTCLFTIRPKGRRAVKGCCGKRVTGEHQSEWCCPSGAADSGTEPEYERLHEDVPVLLLLSHSMRQ